MALLQLKNVVKKYKLAGQGEFLALKGLNVSFDKGELVSVIGESGSGKSTLMNLIGGLDSDFEGEVLYKGDNLRTFKESDLVKYRKENIGFVFQSFNLISHLNLLDNVAMAMTLSNVSKEAREKRAKEVLADMGLKDHMYKKPDAISGGQKQRVAIARALVNDPDIIIADEPTGALDKETTESVLEIIKEIALRGKLVIIVTHSERVAAFSSRVVTIDNGEIIDDKPGQPLEGVEENSVKHVKKKNKNLGFFSAARLSLLNMKEKFSRNALVALGSSIGIMSVVLMLSLGNGVTSYVNDQMNRFVNPEVIEVNNRAEMLGPEQMAEMTSEEQQRAQQEQMANMFGSGEPFTEEDLAKLAEIDHVIEVEKGFTMFGLGTNFVNHGEDQVMMMQFMSSSSNLMESNLMEGTMPESGEVLITDMISEGLGGDVVGETVELAILVDGQTWTREFTVSGVLEAGQSAAYATYSDMEAWFADNEKEVQPNVVYLHAEEVEYADAIKDAVRELGFAGSMQEAMIDMFTTMLDMLTYVLTGIAGISLLVSAIMILVVLNISVVERTKEIGVLKALGARLKDIRRIFVTEAFLLGLFGGVIGVGVAYLIGMIVNHFSNNAFEFSVVQMTLRFAIAGITISIVISMLAGFLPARKAARLDPVESLRRE